MGANPSMRIGRCNPVDGVSWNDCQEFVEKMNAIQKALGIGVLYRLPTLEEWCLACKAGSEGAYCKALEGADITSDDLSEVAWFCLNSEFATHPVGEKKPNAFGIYDMQGNVWEWTQAAEGDDRVLCGGAYDSQASFCEAKYKYCSDPATRDSSFGLRLCADVSAK